MSVTSALCTSHIEKDHILFFRDDLNESGAILFDFLAQDFHLELILMLLVESEWVNRCWRDDGFDKRLDYIIQS